MKIFKAMLPMLGVAAMYYVLHLDPQWQGYSFSLGTGFGIGLGFAWMDGKEAAQREESLG